MKAQRRGGFLLARIHQHAGRIFGRKLRAYHVRLNPAQGRIMFALWQFGGMPIQEIAARTSLGKSTLTSMLDRLERLGYLRRVADPHDRRKTIIELTEKDRALHGLYEKVSAEMTALFYNGFTGSEIDRFERWLERILDNLTTYERSSTEGGLRSGDH